MAEESKRILRRFVDEAWNKKNRQIVYEFLTPDFRHYMPGLKEPLVGPDAYMMLIDMFAVAFPNGRMEIDEVFAEGPRACILWTFVGNHDGEFQGLAPSRKAIHISGVGVARVQKGQTEEGVSVIDNGAFMAMPGGGPH